MSAFVLNSQVEGSGPPVVLLHPVGLDLTCWDAVARALGRRATVVRLDLRGHGASPAGEDEKPDLVDYAADVNATLRELKIEPATIVGLSFGGMVAQALALDHRDRVDRLVVAACPCTLDPAARPVLAARGQKALDEGMGAIVSETLERWFTPDFLTSGSVEQTHERLLRTAPLTWARAWAAISRIETAPRLGEIRVATMCVAGEHDRAAPVSALEAMADRIAGARLEVMAGAPHMMQIERPADFCAAVEAFLRG